MTGNQKLHPTETVKQQSCCLICDSLLCILQRRCELERQLTEQERRKRKMEERGNIMSIKRILIHKCLMEKMIILCPCHAGFVKAVKLAEQIQRTQKTMVNLSMIMFISKFLKTSSVRGGFHPKATIFNLSARCTAAWSCHFLLLWPRKQSSPNHGYNRLTQVDPCRVTVMLVPSVAVE